LIYFIAQAFVPQVKGTCRFGLGMNFIQKNTKQPIIGATEVCGLYQSRKEALQNDKSQSYSARRRH